MVDILLCPAWESISRQILHYVWNDIRGSTVENVPSERSKD